LVDGAAANEPTTGGPLIGGLGRHTASSTTTETSTVLAVMVQSTRRRLPARPPLARTSEGNPGAWARLPEDSLGLGDTWHMYHGHVPVGRRRPRPWAPACCKRGGDRPSFHATSFFELAGDKIAAIIKYWAADEQPPGWRSHGDWAERV
jgi:hypothetical protein